MKLPPLDLSAADAVDASFQRQASDDDTPPEAPYDPKKAKETGQRKRTAAEYAEKTKKPAPKGGDRR